MFFYLFKFRYKQQEKDRSSYTDMVSGQTFQLDCYFHTYCLVSAASKENEQQ